MTVLRIMVCLLHLTSMINKVGACGGNSALEVVEMCKGGSTKARHFYLHGSPAGDVQRCDCSLTLTGVAGPVYFTRALLTDTTATCGGTLTLPNGITVDCTRTSRVDSFLYPGTRMVSFAYNTANVRNCLEVQLAAIASSQMISCPGSQTTTPPVTILSSLPTVSFTYRYTSQTPTTLTTPPTRHVPRSTTSVPTTTVTTPSVSTTQTSTRTSTLSRASSTNVNSRETVTAMPVTVSGSLIAGWVTVAILVAVIVVMAVLLIRTKRASNYEPGDTSQQSVSTQTDGGSIYEALGLDRSNVTTPDTMYERLETQPTVKDYYNIEMGGYANPTVHPLVSIYLVIV